MSGGENQRHEPRYPIRVSVTLLRGRQPIELVTGDVSFRGLFLRTETPPPLRQLVRLDMTLPPESTKVTLHGMVASVERDGMPGFGVQLVGLDGEAKRIWNTFVRFIQIQSQPPPAPDGHPRRSFVRKTELMLMVGAAEDLHGLVAPESVEGGVFVATDLPLPVGVPLRASVVHPETQKTFALDCIVRRRGREGAQAGVLTAFPCTEATREAFLTFAGEVAILGDDDIEED